MNKIDYVLSRPLPKQFEDKIKRNAPNKSEYDIHLLTTKFSHHFGVQLLEVVDTKKFKELKLSNEMIPIVFIRLLSALAFVTLSSFTLGNCLPKNKETSKEEMLNEMINYFKQFFDCCIERGSYYLMEGIENNESRNV